MMYKNEVTCFVHHQQIANGLGITSILHEFSSFQFIGNETYSGLQIDLLIDRADGVINLCEIKFSNATFKLTSAYKSKLRERVNTFSELTKNRKSIFLTLITTYGLNNQDSHLDVIQNVLTLDDLFKH